MEPELAPCHAHKNTCLAKGERILQIGHPGTEVKRSGSPSKHHYICSFAKRNTAPQQHLPGKQPPLKDRKEVQSKVSSFYKCRFSTFLMVRNSFGSALSCITGSPPSSSILISQQQTFELGISSEGFCLTPENLIQLRLVPGIQVIQV